MAVQAPPSTFDYPALNEQLTGYSRGAPSGRERPLLGRPVAKAVKATLAVSLAHLGGTPRCSRLRRAKCGHTSKGETRYFTRRFVPVGGVERCLARARYSMPGRAFCAIIFVGSA